jgi:hypothetical protein
MRGIDIVKLCDWHVPFHDPRAVEVALRFTEQIQPAIIIIDEIHDFYALSRFDKDPTRKHALQEELDTCTAYFARLRRVCPKSRIILLQSNHLDRLRKYLWVKAEELSGLRALRLEELLGLKAHNIEYMDVYEHPSKDPRARFLFKHGNRISKHSGYTARSEMEQEGMSGMSGHSHRLAAHYATRRGGGYVWIEGGCLCDLNAEYVDGITNWQHGVGLVQFRGGHFLAVPVPIIDYELVWGNTVIRAPNRKM